MGQHWKKGEPITAAKLNQTGNDREIRYIARRDTAFTGRANGMITGGGRYLLLAQDGSTRWNVFDRIVPGNPIFDSTNQSYVNFSAVRCAVPYIDNGTHYIMIVENASGNFYRADANGANEAAVTVPSLTGQARRIGYDWATGYFYVQDGADRTSTTIRRYTISGTTMTLVDTITLAAAPTTSTQVIGARMWIGKNYLCISRTVSTSADYQIRMDRYNKDTGAVIDNIEFTAGNPSGRPPRQSQNDLISSENLAMYVGYANDTGTSSDNEIRSVRVDFDDLPNYNY